MQIRQVSIKDFRGVEKLEWKPQSGMNCILGAGDVGKSTILDAIEATLSPKRTPFFDTDFPDCDTTKTIQVEVTVGELPDEAFEEKRFGLYLRGWTAEKEIRDEPQDGDEEVVTIRLTVDESLDPAWEVITERLDPRPISPNERALLGLVRLGSETDTIFAWGQYSPLTKMSTARTGATGILTNAYRQARNLIKENPIPELTAAAEQVRVAAARLGANSGDEFGAGLDTQRSSTSMATLALHGEGVPIRMSGLGTRRLTALAIQRLAVPEGSIVLIDELEHGLEPHRIRHALKVLREQVEGGTDRGQVLLTTHSSITLEELRPSQLAVACRGEEDLSIHVPDDALQPLLRSCAQSFLSRKIIVCEGKTEMGLVRGLQDSWATRHEGEPMEFHGVVSINGDGSSSPERACQLAALGYEVALFVDSDYPLNTANRTRLTEAGVAIAEWPGTASTEDILFSDISNGGIQAMLEIAYRNKGEEKVRRQLATSAGVAVPENPDHETWGRLGMTDLDFRTLLGTTAKTSAYFKRIDLGEEVGRVVASELEAGQTLAASTTLDELERWAYGD